MIKKTHTKRTIIIPNVKSSIRKDKAEKVIRTLLKNKNLPKNKIIITMAGSHFYDAHKLNIK